MRKLLVLLAAFTLVAASCGGEETDTTAARSGSPTPSSSATPDASPQATDEGAAATPSGDDGADPGAPAGSGGDAAAEQTPGPPPPTAQPGRVNRPKIGTYVYDLEGTRTDPFNPAGRSYADDTTSRVDLSASGDVYTSVATNDEDQGSNRTRTRWEDDRVLLLQTATQTPVGTYGCTFQPPIRMIPIPVEPGAAPEQSWSGEDCEGTTEITIHGREDVTDADGKTWSTWKITSRTDYRFKEVSGTLTSTTWLSPDLGMAVKDESHNKGKREATPQDQSFESRTTTRLKSHP